MTLLCIFLERRSPPGLSGVLIGRGWNRQSLLSFTFWCSLSALFSYFSITMVQTRLQAEALLMNTFAWTSPG